MSDLPKGWTGCRLAELVIHTLGGDWGKDVVENLSGYAKVKVIRGTEFRNWKEEKGKSAAERLIKTSSLEKRLLNDGDIVVEVSGGGPTQPVGRTVLIDQATIKISPFPLVCSNFFRQMRISNHIDASFVNYYLTHAYFNGTFNDFQTQTTNLRNLNFTEFLEKTAVLLPPFNEQRRIVEILEKLLGKVDVCRKRLEKIPLILKRFRQSVLAAACSGRLTEDWRNNIEPSSVLLEGVREEWCNNQVRLPDEWQWVSFEKFVISSFYGPRFAKEDYQANGIPTIRTTDINDRGQIVLDNPPCIPLEPDRLAYLGLQHEDLLITRTGATIGKCAIYDEAIGPALPSAYLIRFRLTRQKVSVKYILQFLLSPEGQRMLSGGSTAVAQPNINARAIIKFMIPTPPLAEQQEITRRVDELFKLADQIEARYDKAKAYFDKLSQSILAKAFRGELVEQDPKDEPASVLLERIRAERAANESTKTKTRPPSKKRKQASLFDKA